MREGLDVERIRVRATVNLSGLHLGDLAWVDPTDTYIREQIAMSHLVPEPAPAASVETEG